MTRRVMMSQATMLLVLVLLVCGPDGVLHVLGVIWSGVLRQEAAQELLLTCSPLLDPRALSRRWWQPGPCLWHCGVERHRRMLHRACCGAEWLG